ncbi:MAG: hypothetical protein R3E48_20795 [Burkholderiaceae bacterium]
MTVLERAAEPATGGSGQPAASSHIPVTPDDNRAARLTRAALIQCNEWVPEHLRLGQGKLMLAATGRLAAPARMPCAGSPADRVRPHGRCR